MVKLGRIQDITGWFPTRTYLTIAIEIKSRPYRLDRFADGIDGTSTRTGIIGSRRRVLLLIGGGGDGGGLDCIEQSGHHLLLVERIGRILVVVIEPRVRIGEGRG